MWADIESKLPEILGALCTAVSAGLAKLPSVRLKSMPRMADFARWGVAACPDIETEDGTVTFWDAYAGNRADATETVIEADAVAQTILTFMAGRQQWAGTATELLKLLSGITDEKVTAEKGWPKTAHGLSGRLTRLATALRETGIDIRQRRKNASRQVTIVRLPQPQPDPSQKEYSRDSASPASPASPDSNINGLGGDAGASPPASPGRGASPGDAVDPSVTTSVTPSVTPKSLKNGHNDAVYAGDAKSRINSSRPPRAVSDNPEDRRPEDPDRICNQCAAGGEPLAALTVADGRTVLLHPECRKFWLKANPQPAGAVLAAVMISEISVPAGGRRLPWSTPTLTEVTDPIEAAAIRAACEKPAISAGPTTSSTTSSCDAHDRARTPSKLSRERDVRARGRRAALHRDVQSI